MMNVAAAENHKPDGSVSAPETPQTAGPNDLFEAFDEETGNRQFDFFLLICVKLLILIHL